MSIFLCCVLVLVCILQVQFTCVMYWSWFVFSRFSLPVLCIGPGLDSPGLVYLHVVYWSWFVFSRSSLPVLCIGPGQYSPGLVYLCNVLVLVGILQVQFTCVVYQSWFVFSGSSLPVQCIGPSQYSPGLVYLCCVLVLVCVLQVCSEQRIFCLMLKQGSLYKTLH